MLWILCKLCIDVVPSATRPDRSRCWLAVHAGALSRRSTAARNKQWTQQQGRPPWSAYCCEVLSALDLWRLGTAGSYLHHAKQRLPGGPRQRHRDRALAARATARRGRRVVALHTPAKAAGQGRARATRQSLLNHMFRLTRQPGPPHHAAHSADSLQPRCLAHWTKAPPPDRHSLFSRQQESTTTTKHGVGSSAHFSLAHLTATPSSSSCSTPSSACCAGGVSCQ